VDRRGTDKLCNDIMHYLEEKKASQDEQDITAANDQEELTGNTD